MHSHTLPTPAEIPAHDAAREEALLWRFLHDLFRPPSREQWRWLRSPPAERTWRLLAAGPASPLPADLPLPGAFGDYEEGYLAAYDVGFPAPPCPLQESHWRPDLPAGQVLHENVLFYRHFGLHTRTGASLPPDHLLHQLEFLCVLCAREGASLARQDPAATAPFARAREDFLARHLHTWIGKAQERIAGLPGLGWQTHWVRMARRFAAP